MKKGFILLLENHWDAILASLAACIAIYKLTYIGGIGISPDSIEYIYSAINLKQSLALVDFNNAPMVNFPAGYPLFLSVAYFITGILPDHLAPFLNGFLYVGVIMMSSFIMQGFSNCSRIYRIAILTILASSPCLWELYSMIWSETLFVFLTLVFILAWKNYSTKKTNASLILFAIVAAISFLTRFAGITIIATGFALILFDGSLTTIRKIKQLFLFSTIGVSLLLINLIRNHQVTGTASGVREKALRTLGDNLLDIGGVFGTWLPFIGEHRLAGAILLIVLILFAFGMLVYRILQQQFYQKTETIVYGYFAVYAIFILAVSSISRFEDLSNRLLSPMYIPMLWLGTSWLPIYIQKQTKKYRIALTAISFLLFLFFLANQYKQNAANWEGIGAAGIPGYSELQWKNSPTIQYIKANKDTLNAPVFSDAEGAVFYLTGLHSKVLPHKEIATEKNKFLSHPKSIVIWFYDGENPDLIDMDFIKANKKITATKTFEDGAIYFLQDSVLSKTLLK
ncbi:MAG: hypothetical protein K2Q21_09660 [Chitinophagaceae bacterium]|nr:hypothetical protein [Chitinophagaceae bacterium]